MECGDSKPVENILILNKAIPPSRSSHPSPSTTRGLHCSSRSLNLVNIVYQHPVYQTSGISPSRQNGYFFNTYGTELDYSTASRNSTIQHFQAANSACTEDFPSNQSRHNSIVVTNSTRFSTLGYPHTVQLSNGSSHSDDATQTKEIPLYFKLAWFSFLFFFPLGVVALWKFYESKNYRHRNIERASVASELSRFIATFSILLGIIIYTLIIAIQLRLTYDKGNVLF